MQTIDRQTLKKKIASGADFTLIEVLPQTAFEDSHLPGAINIPLNADDFDERVAAAAGKDDEIVVYCQNTHCDASPKAARKLEALGYTRVFDYEAGKDDWLAADQPVG